LHGYKLVNQYELDITDNSSMTLEREEFISLFKIVFSHRLRVEKINELFDLLDEEKKDYLVRF
jgi:hypothetical protein